MNCFHIIDLERNALPEIKERNKKFLSAFNNIIMTIDRLQGLIEDEYLRLRIESEMIRPDMTNGIITRI